uniref:Uncharacterized protein n=1 Tax=Mesocestoides corti TaxID=53468 RepID=A0A5K3EPM5_MESCO
MTAAGQAYSLRSSNRSGRIEIPRYNYREGKLKSQCFQYGWYVPSERRWQKYQRYHSLPPLTRRDAIDIQREDDYIGLKMKLSRHFEKSLLGNLPGEVPFVKWNGHQRIPQEPCLPDYFPICFSQFTDYPGDYQEALDSFNRPDCRPPRPGCCTTRCVLNGWVIAE